MPLPPQRRSASTRTKPVPNPVEDPASIMNEGTTRPGRQRTATSKQQQNLDDQASKEDAAKQRAYTEALRARQKQEELMGFHKSRAQENCDDNEGNLSAGPESEDEDDGGGQPFTSVTIIQPPSKTRLGPTGRPLVRRPVPANMNKRNVTPGWAQPLPEGTPPRRNPNLVRRPIPADMNKENVTPGWAQLPEGAPPVPPRQNPNLVQRVPGVAAPAPQPIMMTKTAELVHHQPHNQDHEASAIQQECRAQAGPYTPPIQAQYGRPDGTYYSSHLQVDGADASDDEFGTAAGHTYKLPTIYRYKDAHPDLEHFPRSSQSPLARPNSLAQPQSKGKNIRKEPPLTTAVTTTVIVKRPKLEGSGSRGRVRTSDFDDLSKSLIEATISIYKAQIGAIHPFPERTDNRDVVKRGWLEVCNDRGVRVELDEDVFKLITNRASQTHGLLKTISKPYVLQAFNIDGQASKRDVRDKVEQLLEGSKFIYKDPEAKTGIFRNRLLQILVNKMWFKHKEDEGVIHPEFSDDDMLPLATIALVLTVTENNLDEWATGEHVDVPFTATAYKDRYRGHLKRLTDFASKTREEHIIPRLQKHMLKIARKHAKVEDSGVAVQAASISNEDVEAAKQEWEGLVLSDEE